MLKYLRRMSMTVRIIGIAMLVALLGFVAYQLYDFYRDKVGFTPTKTITAWVEALGQGNYQEVYRLTAKQNLTDIYGRPITQDEFIAQVKKVTGERQMPFTTVETAKLLYKQGAYYYVVKLHSTVGGTDSISRLVIEVRREGKEWLVAYPFAIVL
jgi:hypothetical protein